MQLRVYSDLHLEFEPFEVPEPESADVFVLAGDIDVRGRGISFARSLGRPVIYVPGNHEYYGEAIPHFLDTLRAASAGSSVHVLSNDAVVIDGVRFLGSTLWTDWRGNGSVDPQLSMEHARVQVNDFRRIRVSPRFGKLRPEERLRWHFEAKRFLTEQLASPFEGPTVVVTHYVPTLKGVAPAELESTLLGADASNLEPLMGPRADLWIFGHSHVRFDERINGTRLVSNPRGYPDQPVPGFDARCTLEI